MGLGLPFEGQVLWWSEASYAGGRSGTTFWVSSKVYNAKVEAVDPYKALRGVASPTVCGYISMPSDYTFHLEWVHQNTGATKSLPTNAIVKASTGDLNSLCFEMRANEDGATKSYYLMKGCKCKTFNIKGSVKNEYVCTADFSVASVITASTIAYADPTAIASTVTYAQFNKPGHVIYKNTSTAIATVLDTIDITINNNLTDYFSANSIYKQGAIPGALDVTGSMTISLDDGGKAFWDALWIPLTNVYINMNMPGYDIIRLRNCRWNAFPVEINTGNEIMKVNAGFVAKDFTWLSS